MSVLLWVKERERERARARVCEREGGRERESREKARHMESGDRERQRGGERDISPPTAASRSRAPRSPRSLLVLCIIRTLVTTLRYADALSFRTRTHSDVDALDRRLYASRHKDVSQH